MMVAKEQNMSTKLVDISFRAEAATQKRVRRLVKRLKNPMIRTASDWYRSVVYEALRRQEARTEGER